MADLSETLSNRVGGPVESAQRPEPVLSTTGTRAAVFALLARTEALEEAMRELKETVQAIADAQHQSSV